MKNISKKKLVEIIINILADDAESRNDDKRLTFKVLSKLLTNDERSALLSLSLRDLQKLPVFSSITKIRAIIQNDHKQFLPTLGNVRLTRRIDEQEWLDWVTGTPRFSQMR